MIDLELSDTVDRLRRDIKITIQQHQATIKPFLTRAESNAFGVILIKLSTLPIHFISEDYRGARALLDETRKQARERASSPDVAARINALFDSLESTIVERIPQMAEQGDASGSSNSE